MDKMYNLYSDVKDVQQHGTRIKQDIYGTSVVTEESNIGRTGDISGTNTGRSNSAVGDESFKSGTSGHSASTLGGTTGIGDFLGIGSSGLAGNPGATIHSSGGIGESAHDINGRTQEVFSSVERGIDDINKSIGGQPNLSQGSSGRNF